ncbi:MAG: hypothetical protein ACT6QS_06895 [Flavobacteriales bacterium]
MRNLFLFVYFLCLSAVAQQNLKIRGDKELPAGLREISGAVFWDGMLWAHNDGGDEPVLYALDTIDFKIRKKIHIQNAVNTDWEDIAQDETHIYIGDIGNNSGNRNYLQVYKIAKKDIAASTADSVSVRPQIISFSYKDKPAVTQKKHRHNYDAEAMAVANGKLYIFSKNWLRGPSLVYATDTAAGAYELVPVCTLGTDFLVTGAEFSEGRLWVCGYHIELKIENIYAASFAWPPAEGTVLNMEKLYAFTPSFRQLETIAAVPGKGFFLAFEELKAGGIGSGPGVFRFYPE